METKEEVSLVFWPNSSLKGIAILPIKATFKGHNLYNHKRRLAYLETLFNDLIVTLSEGNLQHQVKNHYESTDIFPQAYLEDR